jgi:hypothetical protein
MNTLLLILQLFPLLLESIKAIEIAAPVPNAGAAKLQLLTTTVRSGISPADLATARLSQDQVLTWLQMITATIVTFYTLVGIFKQSAPTATPAS